MPYHQLYELLVRSVKITLKLVRAARRRQSHVSTSQVLLY